jgi:hypothetical protein
MLNNNLNLVNSIHVDDEGMKTVLIADMNELIKSGIVDIPAFINGLLDAKNNRDFNESSDDYIKGYKYGTTN